jgi:hypothetical protein
MKPLKSRLMERWFGKEDFNGMKVISEKFVVAQFSNGKQCLQELKSMLTIPEIKPKLNSHVLWMKHQTMNLSV